MNIIFVKKKNWYTFSVSEVAVDLWSKIISMDYSLPRSQSLLEPLFNRLWTYGIGYPMTIKLGQSAKALPVWDCEIHVEINGALSLYQISYSSLLQTG